MVLTGECTPKRALTSPNHALTSERTSSKRPIRSEFRLFALPTCMRKGKAVYRSDNLSTIIILRDVISKLVTTKQLKVQISCEFSDNSVEHTLRLIHPKMEYQAQLAKKVELASSLKELKAAFGDVSYLNLELTNILLNHDKLYEEAEDKSIYFDRIVGIIVDLFIDRTKVNGLPLGNKANELLQILHEDYTFQNVLKFFEANSK